MATIRITTHEEKRHTLLPTSSCLEEDGLSVLAVGTSHILGPRQRGIRSNVLEHLCALIRTVQHLIPVHTIVVRNLLVIAIPARVEQHLLVAVLSRVQDIVTLAAKLHGTHGGGLGLHTLSALAAKN